MPKLLQLLLMSAVPCQLLAMTQIPLSMRDQLQNADVVIRGQYLGSQVRRLPNGEVITEHSFYLMGHAGINNKDLINRNNFKVHTLGGIWKNENHVVPGMATFADNEEVVLLLKKGQFAYTLSNNSMSKYLVIEKNGIRMLQSALYPTHPEFGEIEYESFQYQVFKHFGERIGLADPDKSIARPHLAHAQQIEKSNRSPADIHGFAKEDQQDESLWGQLQKNLLVIIWPVIILALLGTLYHYAVANKRD